MRKDSKFWIILKKEKIRKVNCKKRKSKIKKISNFGESVLVLGAFLEIVVEFDFEIIGEFEGCGLLDAEWVAEGLQTQPGLGPVPHVVERERSLVQKITFFAKSYYG